MGVSRRLLERASCASFSSVRGELNTINIVKLNNFGVLLCLINSKYKELPVSGRTQKTEHLAGEFYMSVNALNLTILTRKFNYAREHQASA